MFSIHSFVLCYFIVTLTTGSTDEPLSCEVTNDEQNQFNCVQENHNTSCSLSGANLTTSSIITFCSGKDGWTKGKSQKKKDSKEREQFIEASKPNQNSCTITIKHSGMLYASVVVFLDNANITLSLQSDKTTIKKNGTNCLGQWQKIKLNITSHNESTFSINRNKGNGTKKWKIKSINFYTDPNTKHQTHIPSSIASNISTTTSQPKETVSSTTSDSLSTKKTTSETKYDTKTLTKPATRTTETSTMATTATSIMATTATSTMTTTATSTTKVTIEKENEQTDISMAPENIINNNPKKSKTEDEQKSVITALIILFVILAITAGVLGYLGYAYWMKKYPFDFGRRNSPEIRKDISLNELNDFSEYHKVNKVKTVRRKAELPTEESDLEVLINKPVVKTSGPIETKVFEEYLIASIGDDPYDNKLIRQYTKFPTNTHKLTRIGSQMKYESKNRYKHLIAYDDTRVPLKNNNQCDYINANYIDGYENTKAFIATQAPSSSTVADFWWMIWQENVTFIIMLTNLFENGVAKCEKYWPDNDQKVRYGRILIEYASEVLFSDYTERKLRVTCDEETRIIHHLHYTTWPDHDVPLYLQNFAPFIKRILLIQQGKSPIVVHCNAGCGRTGTLILCDIILRMAAKEKMVDFVKIMNRMREQRCYLVNNANQYVFAHFVVLECLFGVDFSIPINDSFQDEIHRVLRKTTIKPLMEQLDKVDLQFRKRKKALPNMTDSEKKKNRFSNIVPGHAQIYLPVSSQNRSNYINAVVVDCYRCPKKFIVTQQPLPNTVNDFWALIQEYNINTVVSLNEIAENDPECPEFWRWADGKTKLHMLEETKDRVYDIMKIKITDESNQINEKTVNIIRMKNWQKTVSYPRGIKDLILLYKEMFNTSWKGDSQIVVTCYDGATASGLFVALVYVLEKINYEQLCDVYSAIRTVRQSREQFVQEWGQMEFLYKAAKIYIEEFDNYENFNN